jgi:hypothetical protein
MQALQTNLLEYGISYMHGLLFMQGKEQKSRSSAFPVKEQLAVCLVHHFISLELRM